MVAIISAAVVFWIPVSVLLLLPFDLALFGVGMGFGLAIVSLLVVGGYLQHLKRRLPDGLHSIYLKKRAQKNIAFFEFGYIDTSQCWDIRREFPVVKIQQNGED